MSAPKIFVTLSTFAEFDPEPLDLLKKSGFSFEINKSGKRMAGKQVIAQARGSEVLIAGVEPYDARTLEFLPKLRALCRVGAGVDSIDLAQAESSGVAVFNTPSHPVDAVAELTLAMMLALIRRIPEQSLLMKAGEWKRLKTHLLGHRRVGIIGLGQIGRRVTDLLKAFGAKVSGYDPYADKKWVKASRVKLLSLDELLETSDIVTIHASQFPAAPLRLGAKEIEKMKKGALLINCARGEMVEEKALVEALKQGRLAGAGLDVFPEEPYSGPLIQLPNVVLTPHCATLTVETRVGMEREAVATAIRFLRGDTDFHNRVV